MSVTYGAAGRLPRDTRSDTAALWPLPSVIRQAVVAAGLRAEGLVSAGTDMGETLRRDGRR